MAKSLSGQEGSQVDADGTKADGASTPKNKSEATKTQVAAKSPAEPRPKAAAPDEAKTANKPPRPIKLAATPRQPTVTAPKVSGRTYIVQPGDTLAVLAEIHYGSQAYADFLLRSNPQVPDARRLAVGMKIVIPPRPADPRQAAYVPPTPKSQAKPKAVVASGKTYTVKAGDSFYKIAANELGDGSRWKQIFELNKDVVKGGPETLQIGQVLRLP
jgi:nucleoid-associated protein YgaU